MLFLLFLCTISGFQKKAWSETEPHFSKELAAQLDQLVQNNMQSDNLPSVVVGIWIPGEGHYLKAFGKANLETGKDRQFDTPFRIASITKTFTATVILSLSDKGLLKTSDPLSRYLPNFPNSKNITIRNLLRMRSGIVDFADAAILDEWYKDTWKNYDLDKLIEIMASRGKDFTQSGQETSYCSGNYAILAKIAETVSNKSFKTLVEENVFQPLKLISTSFPEPDNYILKGNNRGYAWESSKNGFVDKTELNTSCANAAGAIISSMRDLEIYARALYKGSVLSAETQKKRLETKTIKGAPSFCQYGEGIIKFGEFYGHNGTIFGFSTEMFYLPAKDAVIIINVNRLDLDDQSKSGDLFAKISKIIFPDHVSW
jgi:D-alanyl-D-alanine carboxypeptidase